MRIILRNEKALVGMPSFQTDLRKIRQRLGREGWRIVRQSGPHDVYRHAEKSGSVTVPRHRGDLPLGTARAIAEQAGWDRKR